MDPNIDPQTWEFREARLEPLRAWLVERWGDHDGLRVLDFGCGDLQLATLLPPSWSVDGFDTAAAARACARAVVAQTGRSNLRVFDDTAEIPDARYDLIVLSGVVGYVESEEALQALIATLARQLSTDGLRRIVMTEVVTPPRRRLRDAADLFRAQVHELGPLRAPFLLARQVAKSPGRLLAVEPADLERWSDAAGLTAVRLPENLSWLRTRSSWELRG